jgi:hypothetical protein
LFIIQVVIVIPIQLNNNCNHDGCANQIKNPVVFLGIHASKVSSYIQIGGIG